MHRIISLWLWYKSGCTYDTPPPPENSLRILNFWFYNVDVLTNNRNWVFAIEGANNWGKARPLSEFKRF